MCFSLCLGPTTRTTHQRTMKLSTTCLFSAPGTCSSSSNITNALIQLWHSRTHSLNGLQMHPPRSGSLSVTLKQSSRVPLTHGSATADRRSVGCQLIGQLPLICPVYDRTDGYAGCRSVTVGGDRSLCSVDLTKRRGIKSGDKRIGVALSALRHQGVGRGLE